MSTNASLHSHNHVGSEGDLSRLFLMLLNADSLDLIIGTLPHVNTCYIVSSSP
jgi:hypothetical protein